MSVEHLLRGGSRVGDGPVIYSGFRHDSDSVIRYPLPEGDVLGVSVRLDLGFGLDVEYLQCPTGYTRNTISLLRSRKSYRRSVSA